VSKHVAELEESSETQLVIRGSRRIRLTPAGEFVADHVERAEASRRAGARGARSLAGAETGRLAIATSGTGMYLAIMRSLRSTRASARRARSFKSARRSRSSSSSAHTVRSLRSSAGSPPREIWRARPSSRMTSRSSVLRPSRGRGLPCATSRASPGFRARKDPRHEPRSRPRGGISASRRTTHFAPVVGSREAHGREGRGVTGISRYAVIPSSPPGHSRS